MSHSSRSQERSLPSLILLEFSPPPPACLSPSPRPRHCGFLSSSAPHPVVARSRRGRSLKLAIPYLLLRRSLPTSPPLPAGCAGTSTWGKPKAVLGALLQQASSNAPAPDKRPPLPRPRCSTPGRNAGCGRVPTVGSPPSPLRGKKVPSPAPALHRSFLGCPGAVAESSGPHRGLQKRLEAIPAPRGLILAPAPTWVGSRAAATSSGCAAASNCCTGSVARSFHRGWGKSGWRRLGGQPIRGQGGEVWLG